jgi:hypothetical protein
VSVALKQAVRHHSRSSGSVRLLLYLLADYAHGTDTYAYPSMATLSRDLNLSRRAVQRAIRQAVALRELRHEEGRGRKHFSRYYILVCPPEKAVSEPPIAGPGNAVGMPPIREKAASEPPIAAEKAASTTEKAASTTGKGGVAQHQPSATLRELKEKLGDENDPPNGLQRGGNTKAASVAAARELVENPASTEGARREAQRVIDVYGGEASR